MTDDQHNTARVYRAAARAGSAPAARRVAFSPPRRVLAVAFVVAVAAASSACSGGSPSERVEQERKTVASWAASLHLLCDAWREGSVPTRYAAKSLEEAREALGEEAQTLRRELSQGEAEPQRGSALLDSLARLDALAVAAAGAVRAGDRGAAEQIVGALSREQQSLSDLSRGVGAR